MIKYNQKYDRWVTDTGIVYRQDNSGAFIVCKQSDSNGYKIICVSKPSVHSMWVHRLVWETFKGPIPEDLQIDHQDTHKDNNTLSNLKLCTRKENMNNPLTRKHMSETLKGKGKGKNKGNSYRKGKTTSEFGKKFKEHFGITSYQNTSLYNTEYYWYRNHNKICSWEV